ncbi:MAG: hypothetical protein GY842_28730 [bacterium]|nr:hypothetical protein [bacterium]
MIVCSDCREAISRRAKSCPKCGAPQEAARHSTLHRVGRVFFGTGLALFGLATFFGPDTMRGSTAIGLAVCALILVVLEL